MTYLQACAELVDIDAYDQHLSTSWADCPIEMETSTIDSSELTENNIAISILTIEYC